MTIHRREPDLRDPCYGAGYDCECGSCGRLYTTEDDNVKPGMACPDEDCPSHWEEVGRAWPSELTPSGEQLVIPGCERNLATKAKQLDLWG